MMDAMFEDVLAICLDRVSDGDSIESCVTDYPECPDLRPLLEIAAALSECSEDACRRADSAPTWLRPHRYEERLRPTG